MSWKSIPLPDCLIDHYVSRVNQISATNIQPIGEFPVVDQGQAYIAGYTDDIARVIRVGLPYVIFGDHTRCFKYVDFPFVLGADGTKVLKPNPELFDARFFYYAALSLDIPSRGYNRHFSLLKEKLIPRPDIEEQQQIAAVLSAVQRAIERQERLLTLTTELKKTLMHKLFTEGTRGEPLKQTEIGPVPESWSVVALGSVTTTVYRYPTYYSIDYLVTGVPEVRGELLLSSGEIEINLDKYRFISQETAARFPRVRLEIGDLVMSVRGTIGKLGIVRKQQQGGVITANLIRLAPNRRLIDPEYFRWSLMRPAFLAALDAASPQTTIKTITAPALKNLGIPLPSMAEQHTIASAMALVETLHGHQIRRHTLLDELFRALLQQLMTAQIGVHELDLSVLEEIERDPVGAA